MHKTIPHFCQISNHQLPFASGFQHKDWNHQLPSQRVEVPSAWRSACASVCLTLTMLTGLAIAAPVGAQTPLRDARVSSAAATQVAPLLNTLRDLCSIESGSRDVEGLAQVGELIGKRLTQLGATVQLLTPDPASIYRMGDTPESLGKMVYATFTGTGTKKILLLAHMDTVYLKGMGAAQPFRMGTGEEANRAYGLGISDDKQGIAVILHAMAVLAAIDFKSYGTVTVLINADEEISSPGSRSLISKLGSVHDAVLSFEASRVGNDKLSLATSGIASVDLKVIGRASHAGAAPERGVNALVELSHQILQMRDFSEPANGLKMNWTIAQAGTNRNVIPAYASAQADVRVLRVSDYDRIEKLVRDRAKNQLVADAKVEVTFERRRPPLEATGASRALAAHAQSIYSELGKKLNVDDEPEGGGTDAAFAALNTKAPVIERFGLQGFGGHTASAEYVLVDSIEPRLYLVARMIMDLANGRVR